MTSTSSKGIGGLFGRFPKVYWVVLFFELMERGAYYSMMPILVVHFFWNVGLSQELCLLLTVFMYPFQYAMPIITSALAEKVGYKRQMIFGFVTLAIAYLFLSFAFNWITAILSMMMIGFGIGCYKPLVSSTIAKSTVQKDRNVAYSVYYWIVNFAATFFALTWGLLMLAKILPDSAFAWIFRVSAIYFIINVFVAIYVFKEVPRTGAVKTLGDVGRNIATAFKDKKFVVMMLLIAGFWALYATTLAPFIMIMYGYRFIPIWIPVILLGVINPGTIILLGAPLSKYAEKIESIKLLMGGVFIYLIGLTLITVFLEYLAIVVLGMIIYSIGEFMVAPGYLAFVSKLAPKEKVSAYIGCNFLASFTGIFGGALILGLLASIIAVDMARPHFYFGLLMGFGLFVLILFMLYNREWGKDIINRAKRIEMEETGAHEHEIDGRRLKREPLLFKIFDYKATMVVAALLIPVFLVSTYAMGTNVFYPPELDEEIDVKEIWIEKTQVISANDYTEESASTVVPFQIKGIVKNISVSLSWDDEPPNRPMLQDNEPDSFSVELFAPNGTVALEQDSGNSPLSIDLKASEEQEFEEGDWTIVVTCTSAGDVAGRFFGLIGYADNGNEWDMRINVDYLELVPPEDEVS
ncbi:MAG: MFS transporter [Candidatus Thermoplasmatota archaeon]|nr:MFS transporter [Candidatus Thermoplasmatota archaeon]